MEQLEFQITCPGKYLTRNGDIATVTRLSPDGDDMFVCWGYDSEQLRSWMRNGRYLRDGIDSPVDIVSPYVETTIHPTTSEGGGGLRYDDNKLRVDLVPIEWTTELARVLTIGAHKYQDRNWELGMPWSKCVGALQRHFLRWQSGNMVDAETGCHELAMVAWNALALMSYQLRELGLDDRSPVFIDDKFQWTKGPGTELGLAPEKIEEIKQKYKRG